MTRRTKILATLGPSTDDPEILRRLILSGVNVVRINLSHGSADDHQKRIELLQQITSELEHPVGVVADLQGPKIRIASFAAGSVELKEGASFTIDTNLGEDDGNQEAVGCHYPDLHRDMSAGDRLLLDDGRLVLEVDAIENECVRCHVAIGGTLSGHKGINRQGGGLSAKALTPKDLEDIKLAAKMEVDYLAISFVRSAHDIYQAKQMLHKAGALKCGIIAKIERQEALDNIEEIIEASDAVMIARGDLGVEIGDAALPPVQKQIISQARHMNRAVITATQMMESMIKNSIPTRAEVFDVANAVLDGTDAIMLSAETSVGEHPVETVEAMDRICLEAEKQRLATTSNHRINTKFTQIDEAIAMATMYTANHLV
jgi:pyruvate kinase